MTFSRSVPDGIFIATVSPSQQISFVSAFVVALPGACLNLLFVAPHLDYSILLAFSRNFKKHQQRANVVIHHNAFTNAPSLFPLVYYYGCDWI
jgi:hypothetical protein